MANDPYSYPGTDVLRNHFGITEAEALAEVESELTLLNLRHLMDQPLAGDYDLAHLQDFHAAVFGDLYPWAGQIRTVDIAKGAWFCSSRHIESFAADVFGQLAGRDRLRGLDREKFVYALADFYGDLNALHPFREGNGRAQRAFLGQLAGEAGYRIAWERLDGARNDEASAKSLAGSQEALSAMLDDLVERA